MARLYWSGSCQRAVIVGGILLSVAILIVNLTTSSLYDSSSPELNNLLELSKTFQVTTLVLSGIAAIGVTVMLAGSVAGTGNAEMNRFLAMTPLSDRELSASLFGNLWKTCLACIVMLQLALLLSYVGFMLMQGTTIFHSNYDLGDWLKQNLIYSSLGIIGFWILAANLLALCWTGRQWVCNTIVGVVVGGNFSFMIFSQILASQGFHEAVQLLEKIVLLVMTLTIISATVGAFLDAGKRCLIQKRTGYAALCFSIVGLSLFEIWVLQQEVLSDHGLWFLLISTLIALIVAPFATIPLALSWNRHR